MIFSEKITKILFTVLIFTIFLTPLAASAFINEWFYNYDIGGELDLTEEPVDYLALEIVAWLLTLTGLVSVVFVLYGGFIWLTSAGNEEKITKAKGILKAAIIGLVVVILSWAILDFVHDVVINATT